MTRLWISGALAIGLFCRGPFPGTRGVQGRANRSEEDLQDAARHLRIAVEVGSLAFQCRAVAKPVSAPTIADDRP